VARIIKLGAIQTDSTIATPAGFSNRGKSGQIIFGQFFSYGQSLEGPVCLRLVNFYTLAKQGGTIYHERFANDRRCQKD
jgi:hypothetical protein